DVVLILTHAGLTLGREHADDLARQLLDPDLLAQRIGCAEQLLLRGFTEHAEHAPGLDFDVGQAPARGDRVTTHVEILVGRSGDAGSIVAIPPHHERLLLRRGRDLFGAGDVAPDRVHVLFLERGGRGKTAGTTKSPGRNDQQIVTELADLVL